MATAPEPNPLGTEDWAALLTAELGRAVRVRYGRARRDVIVARSGMDGTLFVRMNAVFAFAPPNVQRAVARWLSSGPRARGADAVLDRWIDAKGPELSRAAVRTTTIRAKGLQHDLDELARGLRREIGTNLLPPESWPRLTWGRRCRTAARRSLHLGSFEADPGLVRIHPVLDQAAVPPFFVRYVLFHELLHAALPPRRGPGGRTIYHGQEFVRRERGYADYARAIAWQDEHLERLLRSARTGEPVPVRLDRRRARGAGALPQGTLFGT